MLSSDGNRGEVSAKGEGEKATNGWKGKIDRRREEEKSTMEIERDDVVAWNQRKGEGEKVTDEWGSGRKSIREAREEKKSMTEIGETKSGAESL